MNPWVEIAIASLGGYLLGSIPFGLILTRMAGLGDVRKIGSGNIGATNVLRTGNKGLALATLLLDGGKGALAVLINWRFEPACAAIHALDPSGEMLVLWGCRPTPDPVLFAAAFAFLGHLFPVWLKFKGGKGVATFLGIALGLDLAFGAVLCAIWLATALVLRWSSLAALIAAFASPFLAFFMLGGIPPLVLFAFMMFLIFLRHRANIARLLKGEEPKIGQK